MNVHELVKDLPAPATPELAELVEQYKRIRAIMMSICHSLMDDVEEGEPIDAARKLGLIKGRALFINSDFDNSVLMDYTIFEMRRNGLNAVQRRLRRAPPPPGTLERSVLEALARARFRLIVVEAIEPGVGVRVRNLATDERRLVVDIGYSVSSNVGLVLAVRIVDFPDFSTSTGAGCPIGVVPEEDLPPFVALAKDYTPGDNRPGADPAQFLREYLGSPARPRVELNEPVKSREQNETALRHAPAPRSMRFRQPNPPQNTSPSRNSLCPCGSGKKFKACCLR